MAGEERLAAAVTDTPPETTSGSQAQTLASLTRLFWSPRCSIWSLDRIRIHFRTA